MAPLVLVSAVVAGCGGDTDPASSDDDGGTSQASAEINILVPNTTTVIVDPVRQILSPEFTQRTNVTTTFLDAGGDYGAVDERILADSVAGDLADAAIIGSQSLRTYVDSGLAQPFDPVIEADSSYDPESAESQLMEFGVIDGETFAVPLTASWLVLYYNPAVFEAAGLDPEQPPSTFTELAAAARQIVSSGAAQYGLGFGHDFPSQWLLQNLVESAGGSFTNDDESALSLEDPELVEAVDFLSGLAGEGVLPVYDRATVREAFFRGDIGMMYDSSSGYGTFAESSNFDIRTAPYPIPDDGTRVLPAAGASIVMFTDDPARQEAVWAAVRELTGPAGSAAFIDYQVGVLAVDAATNQEKAAALPLLQLGLDEIDAFEPQYQFPGSSAVEIWSILQDEFVAALNGNKEAADAMADAQRAAEPLLP